MPFNPESTRRITAMTAVLSILAIAALFFLAGVGWGQWWAERQIRRASAAQAKGRLQVTMPVDSQDAATILAVLKETFEKVEAERPFRQN
jgi:predicted deacetylase